MKSRLSLLIVLVLLFAICGVRSGVHAQNGKVLDQDGELIKGDPDANPTGEDQEFSLTKSVHRMSSDHDVDLNRLAHSANTLAPLARGNGISYHGGPVFTSAANVYLIWYGNWSGDTATTILPKLVTGLVGLPTTRSIPPITTARTVTSRM